MKKIMTIVAALAVGILGTTSARAQCNGVSSGNLITNCGFESGDFTGWSGTITTEIDPNVAGVDGSIPYEGNFEAYMGVNGIGTGATEDLSQTFSTTAGTTYSIAFALMNDTTPDTDHNSFLATFGGITLLSQIDTPVDDYMLYTYQVVAGGGSTTLDFTSRNDAGYFDLDSVSVSPVGASAVPEPSSFVLLGTGIVGLAGAARRRFKI